MTNEIRIILDEIKVNNEAIERLQNENSSKLAIIGHILSRNDNKPYTDKMAIEKLLDDLNSL